MPLSPLSTAQLFYQNDAGQVFYHPTGYVQLSWQPVRTSVADIQAFYERTLQLLSSTGSYKLVSEHGQRPPLPPAAQRWLQDHWMPQVLRLHNPHYCAIVEGLDPLHRLATQSVVSQAPAGFEFKRFATTPEAVRWLQQLA